MPTTETASTYAFGQYRLTPAKRQLIDSDGDGVVLRGKIYDLLWYLVQNKGRLVSKSELMEALWPDTVVEENNLNQTVSALRQALDDNAKTPKLIATIKGRGYQFIADVGIVRDTAEPPDTVSHELPAAGGRRGAALFFGVAAALLIAILAYYRFSSISSRLPEITIAEDSPSIAVLPFENRSANDDDAFFVEGIHDDILTSLAKIGAIKVISRTSVAQFRDPDRVIPEIAEELGVSAVLEGAVQRAGDRVRINVQLIDAATDAHVWAESYDRLLTVENIFAIQSEISNTIATAMHAELTAQERDRIHHVPTDNLAAYEAYLLGNQKLERRTGAALEEARAYFEEAIHLDPDFALAHVGLADSYLILLTYSNKTWPELEPPARAAVEKAIELDASLGEAYATLAMINTESGNHDVAGPQFQRSISLSPNYAPAYHWYASHFFRTGRTPRAVEQLETAVRLDPLSPILRFSLSAYNLQLAHYDESKFHLRKSIEIDPGFARGYWGLANVYQQIDGDLDDAAIVAKRALELDSAVPTHYSLLASIYIDLGDDAEAARWLAEAGKLDSEGINYVVTALHLAMLRGDKEAAARMSEEYLDVHSYSIMVATPAINAHLKAGRFQNAVDIIGARDPNLLDSKNIKISNRNVRSAIALTNVYQRAGATQQARELLNRIVAYLESPSFRTFPLFQISDVQILILQGKKAEALATLRQHVDAGWRFQAHYHLTFDPVLDPIREEPEFIAIAEDVRADIAAQRESLREMLANEVGQ